MPKLLFQYTMLGFGLVICRSGEPPEPHTNFFSVEDDVPILDEAGKQVNVFQKPMELMEKLVHLFTTPGDWVLDGLSGTGMYSILIFICSTFYLKTTVVNDEETNSGIDSPQY